MISSLSAPTIPKAADIHPDVNPEFFVSTYTASQFYQPRPTNWIKTKTVFLKNIEKAGKDALRALETLAEIDLLIDHKVNVIAEFTPNNAFDIAEDAQLERLARLSEIRRTLEGTGSGLANLYALLKMSCEHLIYATGISRSHAVFAPFTLLYHCRTNTNEYLTAHLPIVPFRTTFFALTSTDTSLIELFFDDRTRAIRLHQGGSQYSHESKEVTLSLRDIWKATWAEQNAKVILHVLDTDEMSYESCLMEMNAPGDARGFLQKMSGVASFKLCRVESEQMGELFTRGPKSVKIPE
ncbi:MAG: hypothetical protein Q9208_004158 [Pyrenodesmia sp. 3 TL-2023]